MKSLDQITKTQTLQNLNKRDEIEVNEEWYIITTIKMQLYIDGSATPERTNNDKKKKNSTM